MPALNKAELKNRLLAVKEAPAEIYCSAQNRLVRAQRLPGQRSNLERALVAALAAGPLEARDFSELRARAAAEFPPAFGKT